MTRLDWSVVILYFILATGVGVSLARRGGRSLSDYFVGGRALPWWLAGTSMVATTFAADTPLAVTELVVQYGVAGKLALVEHGDERDPHRVFLRTPLASGRGPYGRGVHRASVRRKAGCDSSRVQGRVSRGARQPDRHGLG